MNEAQSPLAQIHIPPANFKKYGKRCLSLFLAASMILMPAVQIFAEEETAAATTDSTQTAEEDRETQR